MEDKEINRVSDAYNSLMNESTSNINKIGGESRGNHKRKEFNSLFAYDSSKNEYELNGEINELDEKNKTYIETTIQKFNNELKSKTSYVPCYYMIFYGFAYLFSVLLFILFLYLSILFCALCLFNPMIIIAILFFGLTKGMAVIYFIHCKIQDNKKSKKINSLIQRENDEQAKNKPYLQWNYGRDGSWIEVKIPLKR